jgi:hypothetical protein
LRNTREKGSKMNKKKKLSGWKSKTRNTHLLTSTTFETLKSNRSK